MEIYWVDIPQEGDESYKNVATFKTHEEALAYVKEKFGADDNGMVSLITGG